MKHGNGNSAKVIFRTGFFVIILCTAGMVSCGVKGKPLPPLEPAEIGRGAPTYKRAAEQAKPNAVPSPNRRGP